MTQTIVSRHVRYWRGAIHRWSMPFSVVGTESLSGTSLVDAWKDAVSEICYSANGDQDGGVFQCDFYDTAVRRTPLETNTYFDWRDPSTWSGYTASAWNDLTRELESAAEVAMLIKWNGGLGHTGKPVFFRHWVHAVPVSPSHLGNSDFSTGQIETMQSYLNNFSVVLNAHGLAQGNARRLADNTTRDVAPYYENHQMPRGRRRKSA